MAIDHYIPQVYLRQFCLPSEAGKVFAINKSDLSVFITSPRNVCAINQGNRNQHLSDPDLLEKLYAVFEPGFPKALGNLRERKCSELSRVVISSLMAAISLAAPTFKRLLRNSTETLLREQAYKLDKEGKIPPFPESDNPEFSNRSLSDLLKAGQVNIDVDMQMPQALATTKFQNIAHAFEVSNWNILHLHTHESFITSDFPITLFDKRIAGSFPRFFPIAPDIGLMLDPMRVNDVATLTQQAHINITSKSQLADLNRSVIKSAERQVFANYRSEKLRTLVSKYRKHSLIIDPLTQALAYTENAETP